VVGGLPLSRLRLMKFIEPKAWKCSLKKMGITSLKTIFLGTKSPKEISSFGITSKDINGYEIENTATFKDGSEITLSKNGELFMEI
jgi:hypothetical protein